ncbi:acyl-CoA dehydrogenase family protein [Microvirga massiliensis]|uniref:acyl-CoA dehydrogenase family protein n=1 Tax=Microvirga massiliensis TaxID=1033741 RepID=UPI00062BEFA9|nr:acyl-CoA dehydrogenase family protein [Microvirga massiliensis]
MNALDDYGYSTHEVLNQPPPLCDYDAFRTDETLRRVVDVFDAGWASAKLSEAGRTVGSAHVQELARQANRVGPELRTHDRFGNRADRIDFHPAWHELIGLAIGQETHSLAWTQERSGAQVARAALSYLWNQGENGICCPIGMTYSAIPILRRDSERWAEWGERILSNRYDRRQIRASDKTGATVGMAMTEKQGGSDLRQTQTYATPNADGTWSLVGHKWFFSVPHSDVFLTLARTETGVSCFVAAGWLPDGSRNRIQIQRLKDKCGNRSNASSEVEFRGAIAHLIGEPGRGIRTGLEMNHYTRLDFAVGSAGLMRQAVAQSAHHVAHRRAFQRALIDQPIMANVVADLALEVEAATWLSFRFVAALDRERQSESERLLGRIGAPIAKYWICKRAPAVVVEALECHGGNGFIEDHLMARLYREAPLNGIWEGTGNVICLDVLRSMAREPGCVPALLDELRQARGADRDYDRFVDVLDAELTDLGRHEGQARRLVERLALALSAGLLLRHAPDPVAGAFIKARLAGPWAGHFGDLPHGLAVDTMARRAVPNLV